MRKYQKIVIWIGIGISLVCSLTMIYLFVWHHREASTDYQVNTEAVGQYGDFIGGVVGTVLSILLLYFTFSLQREDSDNNAQIYQNQILNEEFFHLLDLYRDTLKRFVYKSEDDDGGEYYDGKDALTRILEKMYNDYNANCRNAAKRREALNMYISFYSDQYDVASIYFRTLFRICQVIDDSKCEEKTKVGYAKILRAQLTHTELALMRYNAMTSIGANFRAYINKYNLMKHIQPLDLLEFKQWALHLSTSDKSKGNITLISVKGAIKRIMKNMVYNNTVMFNDATKYLLIVESNEIHSEIKVTLKRKSNVVTPAINTMGWMDLLSKEQIEEIIYFFLYEFFIISNFNMFNIRRDIKFGNEIFEVNEEETIAVSIENKLGQPLQLSYNYYNQK